MEFTLPIVAVVFAIVGVVFLAVVVGIAASYFRGGKF